MTGKIYKITNLINSKIYIGKTIKSLQERFNKHCWEDRSGNHFYMPIKRAIKKYGKENFKIELIEECDIDILNEREIYWISKYDSFKSENGYNCTVGGDGNCKRKLSPEDEAKVVNFNLNGKSTLWIAKEFNIDKTSVSNIIKRSNSSLIVWRNISTRVDVNSFNNDVYNGMKIKDLIIKYNISRSSVFNLIKNYRIKHLQECPSPILNGGEKCTPNYVDDKDIELVDKEPLR